MIKKSSIICFDPLIYPLNIIFDQRDTTCKLFVKQDVGSFKLNTSGAIFWH